MSENAVSENTVSSQSSGNMIPMLDHGYIQLIETWGSDERIIEAARMSTGKGFLGWEAGECPECAGQGRVEGDKYIWDAYPEITDSGLDFGARHIVRGLIECFTCNGKGQLSGDQRLLKYLYSNRHHTPFEMAGGTICLQAPIMVYREWHRHRTQCLEGNTTVHFDAPKSKENRRFVYKQTIAELHRKWQPSRRVSRPERQTNAEQGRNRIHRMQLRMLHESNMEINHTRIMSVIKGEPKSMFEVTVESGKKITTSLCHRYFTDQGWLTLEQAIDMKARVAVETVLSGQPKSWEVTHDFSNEVWKPICGIEVSSEGRVRNGLIPFYGTEGEQGYPVAYTPRGTKAVHLLVLEAFVGSMEGMEARHLNNNRADCRLKNLTWGTSKENAQDRLESDRQQRLRSGFERITNVRPVGMQDSYDLEVSGPYHNFIANGFAIHNSYNEMSARYIPMPNLNYIPSVDRMMVIAEKNKQAGKVVGSEDLTREKCEQWRYLLEAGYNGAESIYQYGLTLGVPKELARLIVPVGRYSRMMASANLRNWLAFLTLRMDSAAQWEIRQYANEVGEFVKSRFPKTWELFVEGRGPK